MRLYLFFITFLAISSIHAQQHYFLYIQTENKQPFYVKANEKIFSSSATGYVVISKLSADIHVFTIGFNKDEFPEQNFKLVVNKDAGYLLKNYGASGWGLLNLQNNDVVMNGSEPKPGNGNEEDAFSKTLAQVVNTPDLKDEKIVKKEIPKVTADNEPIAGKDKAGTQVSVIKILMNEKDNAGRQLVYLDGNDTVRILIEGNVLKENKPEPEVKQSDGKNNIDTAALKAVEKNKPAKENSSNVINPKTEIKMINSDCKIFASQDEFLKLRKKMAAEKTDEDMVSVAKKQFRSRCFATEQIRNLSVLFLTDESKYKFLDAAYPFVHDSSEFSSLESILSDDYYKARFKAMIRH